MTKMFKTPAMPEITMPATPEPEAPKVVRMPTRFNPTVEAAAERTRAGAMRRKGRLSTIMTDRTGGTSGYPSSGRKLGA